MLNDKSQVNKFPEASSCLLQLFLPKNITENTLIFSSQAAMVLCFDEETSSEYRSAYGDTDVIGKRLYTSANCR